MFKMAHLTDRSSMPPPDPAGDALILRSLEHFLDQGPRQVHAAWGNASPPAQATVSASPRLVLGISGRNRMLIPKDRQEKEICLRSGDLVCIDRRSWNLPLHLHAKCFMCIDCKRDRIRYYLRRTRGPGSLPAEGCISWVERPAAACTQHLIAACESLLPQEERGPLLHDCCCCLLKQYLSEFRLPTVAGGETHTWLRICDWIDDHLHDAIDRMAVARAVGVHPNHVSRLFRRHAGKRFVDHLRDLRLERAQSLLIESGFSVGAIAQRCGFSSSEYFSSVFHRQCGLPPGRWRAAAQDAGRASAGTSG